MCSDRRTKDAQKSVKGCKHILSQVSLLKPTVVSKSNVKTRDMLVVLKFFCWTMMTGIELYGTTYMPIPWPGWS